MFLRMEIGRDKGEIKEFPEDIGRQMLIDRKATLPSWKNPEVVEVNKPEETTITLPTPTPIPSRKGKR